MRWPAWLLIAKPVSSSGMTLAQMVEPCIATSSCSGEISFKVADGLPQCSGYRIAMRWLQRR